MSDPTGSGSEDRESSVEIAGLTSSGTLVAAARGPYRTLRRGPGEPHIRRLDLAPGARGAADPGRTLLHFAHITDVHLLDTASPGRLEFAERLYGTSPALSLLLPAYRPQECLQLHACEAMVRTLNGIKTSPVTGAPLQRVMSTGDVLDNGQLNELRQFLRLMKGGTAVPWAGGAQGEGVTWDHWGDDAYWHPGEMPDVYKREWGFPAHPGLLAEASRPLLLNGLELPWLAVHGNHDALVQGTGVPTEAFAGIVTGPEKPRLFPPGFDPITHLGDFIGHPELFLSGPTASVMPEASRRPVTRREVLEAYAGASGEPRGHGFSPDNVERDLAYYVDDSVPGVRLIALDTVNPAGHYQGSIGAAQLDWLEHRLAEVHSHYWDAGGLEVRHRVDDRLVVICSHHGRESLINDRSDPGRERDLPRVLGPELEATLHRFPNVILWINGHTHRNAVRARPDPAGRTAGFWEVTTSSLIDWPCQARLIEIVANADGSISIFGTMVDHAAPPDPGQADDLYRLAALHRELAANDPHGGIRSGKAGSATDRNVELVLEPPFIPM